MNKTIWMYWHQGWSEAPELCKVCSHTWKYHNPEWKIRKLDSKVINIYIPELEKNHPGIEDKVCKAHYSDVIRLYLLIKYGGVWVDASLFCNDKLDNWLPGSTFMFSSPRENKLISNWFISSPRNSYILKAFFNRCMKYLKKQDDYITEYHWQHNIFKGLYNKDIKFKKEWDKQVKISCRIDEPGPHLFSRKNKTPMTEEELNRYHSKVDPCYKLKCKNNITEDSAWYYMISEHLNITGNTLI
jgi:mannosyltransferase OCH1-like enzyme